MNEQNRTIPPEFGVARERFLGLVEEVRPELHRYCSRLMGSVIEGEDVVQEALAKAFYHMTLATELPPLRPWLFRIAHNVAVDALRSYEKRHVEPQGGFDDTAALESVPPEVVRLALSVFLRLPVSQRSAVILKDVLDHSLDEIADTMGTTVPAVKAALLRGRSALRQGDEAAAEGESPAKNGNPHVAPTLAQAVIHSERRNLLQTGERERLGRYVRLFNERNWDGLRALLSEECRLDLVSKAARRGKEVHEYFSRYALETKAHMATGTVEGRPAVLFFKTNEEKQPSYFILFEWNQDEIVTIRDFRYVPYITADAAISVDG